MALQFAAECTDMDEGRAGEMYLVFRVRFPCVPIYPRVLPHPESPHFPGPSRRTRWASDWALVVAVSCPLDPLASVGRALWATSPCPTHHPPRRWVCPASFRMGVWLASASCPGRDLDAVIVGTTGPRLTFCIGCSCDGRVYCFGDPPGAGGKAVAVRVCGVSQAPLARCVRCFMPSLP